MDSRAKISPPAIWNAGTVIPKKTKIAPPATAKTASTATAARQARAAARRRSAGEPEVIATKIGAAEMGLITEKREEKASSANCDSGDLGIGSATGRPATSSPSCRAGGVRLPLVPARAARFGRR